MEVDKYTKVFIQTENFPILHQFFQCTLHMFGETKEDKIMVNVNLDLDENRIVIKRAKDGEGLLCTHAPKCPMRFLPSTSELHLKSPQPFVRIAVSILLENEKDEVLITRRAAHMRTFPNVWVLPGGHLDPGEHSFTQAGCRELFEETGIQLHETQLSPFLFYESVFPVLLEEGHPSRHHLVVYLIGKISGPISLQCQKEEVGAAAWISKKTIELSFKEGSIDETFDAWVLVNNSFEHQLLKVSQLEQCDQSGALKEERLSTGTRITLRHWIDNYKGK